MSSKQYRNVLANDRTTQFAKDVVSGKYVVGESQLQSCQRHLNDLERQGTEEFPFYFDVEQANEIIDFAECLTIAEGIEHEALELFEFQAFIFGSLNGWTNENGFRRFRTSYVQLSRQQGKSLFNAVLSIYYGNFYGYKYGQLYTVATKSEQAKIVLKECEKFINADFDLSETFNVKMYKGEIECNLTNSVIKALGKDSKSIDGFRTFFGSIDEYHAHKDDQMYKLLQTGTKQMRESLISVITTSGFNLNSPCFQLYEYCKQVLAGVVVDETQFVFITEMNKDDDPYCEENWKKSNPLWTEEGLESMRTFATKAKAMGGSEEMEFFTKSLNMWVDFGDSVYIGSSYWKICSSEMELAEFLEKYPDVTCYIGLDLSSGGDLTSLALVFVYSENGVRKYYIYSHSFIPSKRVREHELTDKIPYRMWINKGLLTVTETLAGIKTDYKYIIAHLKDLIEKYNLNIQMICYDPHNASAFLYDLESLGYQNVLITQSAKNLNDPTSDFSLEVKAGNVQYDSQSHLLTWSVVNSKTVRNSFKEIKIDKESASNRIDPVDAVICAWKMAMRGEVADIKEITSNYLEMMGW